MYDTPEEPNDPNRGKGEFKGRYRGVGFGIAFATTGKDKECGVRIRTKEGGLAEIRFDDVGQFKHTFLAPLTEFSKAAQAATSPTGEIDAEAYATRSAAIIRRYKSIMG